MSAFVCIFHRDGRPVARRQLADLAAALSSYGDEVATWCRGPLGITVRGRPGDGGGEPLQSDAASGRVAALAGRLHLPGGSALADGAALALGGDDRLAAARGTFALVVADPRRGRVRVVRDPLGKHAVYHFHTPSLVIAASEPSALLAHPAVGGEVDERAVARFLAFRFPHGERSFFRHLRQLPAGHRLEVGEDGVKVERWWRFPPVAARRGDAAEELRHRLAFAVGDEMAGLPPERVAISLSGGLDSTAVAALAPRRVRAFSWTFDDDPRADERRRVEAVCRHLGLDVVLVPGDGLHPLAGDFAARFVHSESPYLNPFSALKCRLYETARAAGCERVLVGDGGDALYAARDYWLRDLLAARRPGALASLAATLRRAGAGDRFARRALGRLLAPDSLRPPLRRLLRREPPPWLTREGRATLPAGPFSPTLPAGRGAVRHELTAGVRHGELESEERRLFARCGVGRGNPFWSWPLLAWAMRLPAYELHRDGEDKPLVRRALAGRLPVDVLAAGRGGLLGGLFLRGLELRRGDLRDTLLERPRSDWQRYVRRDWLAPYLAGGRTISFGHTILWRVLCYELWVRRRLGVGWP